MVCLCGVGLFCMFELVAWFVLGVVVYVGGLCILVTCLIVYYNGLVVM